mgnify:CR=1 FL=1
MKIVCFGEIMLRLTPHVFQKIEQAKSFLHDYGGSESNVSVTLAQLGAEVYYVTRVPDNPFGQSALNSLAQFGVDTGRSVKGGGRLGIYFVELGSGRRNSKVIYDRSHSGMHSLKPGMIDWKTVLKDTDWFHWSGITPSLSMEAASATEEALSVASELKLKISCDLNYRSKLWQYGVKPFEVMPRLIEYCDVLFGDLDVMDVYFGIQSQSMEIDVMNLQKRFPKLSYIALSDREGLSATHNTYQGFLFHNGKSYISKKYDMPDMIDRIGSGDAFAGGLIYQLAYTQNKLDYAIDYATATSVYKHYVPGDMNCITKDDVESLMKGGSGAKVKR